MTTNRQIGLLSMPVLVAALGYFVDVYDLLLFTIVRQPSVMAVGATAKSIIEDSAHIINWQMSGLLIGGILWGVIGDKYGRLKVLFGSIMLYSVANILTSFVQSVDQYAYCRFIGGIGLAGELGAGITLVSEMLPKNKRGIGTSMVAGIGLSGAVFAYFTFQYTKQWGLHYTMGGININDWRICYQIGGVLGIFLLILRIRVSESFMFESVKLANVSKGNFLQFFSNKKRFSKYVKAILIGLPTWFVIGVLVNYSNKFASELYESLLSAKIERIQWNQDNLRNFSYFPIILPSEEKLIHIIAKLREEEIYPRRYFYPALNELPYLTYQSCPVAEDISKRILCLPLSAEISADNIQKITKIINSSL